MRKEQLAKEMRVSRSTVSRELARLREDGWLAAPDELDPGERWHELDPARPGLRERLAYLQVEHGTDADGFWKWQETRTLPWFLRDPAPIVSVDPAPVSLADVLHGQGLPGAPIPARVYRGLATGLRQIRSWYGSLDHIHQALWAVRHDERDRDLIHYWINNWPKLPAPPAKLENDARPELAMLAVTCHNAALGMAYIAQHLLAAQVISDDLARQDAQLVVDLLGHPAPSQGERLLASERARRLRHQLDSRDGRDYYHHHGGTPSHCMIGRSGEAVLAVEFFDRARTLETIAEAITTMDAMASVMRLAAVVEQWHAGEVALELRGPELASKGVQEDFRHSPLSDASGPEQTISPTQMRVGDWITDLGSGRFPYPLNVTALSDDAVTVWAPDRAVALNRDQLPAKTITVIRGS